VAQDSGGIRCEEYEQSLDGTLDKLDKVVAKAFKIPVEEVAFIKSEFKPTHAPSRAPNLLSPTATSSASARASLLPTVREGVQDAALAGEELSVEGRSLHGLFMFS